MKKILLFLIASLIISGCEKSTIIIDKENDTTKFPVTFSANFVEVNLNQIGKKANSNNPTSSNTIINEGISYVDYLIYDKSNNLVASKTNFVYDDLGNIQSNFKEFNVELPNGEYKIIAIARTDNGKLISPENMAEISIEFPSFTQNNFNIVEFKTIYLQRPSIFTVNNAPVSQELKLTRINSQVQLNLKTEFPTDVRYILFGGKSSSKIFLLGDKLNADFGKSYILFDKKKLLEFPESPLNNIFYPIHPSSDNNNLEEEYEILLLDKDFKLLGSKKIPNVYFKENHITKLSGDFFDTLGSSKSTLINIDFIEEYNQNIIEKQF